MNKMVINHLGKLFVTNDAATIIRELDVWMLLVFIESVFINNNFCLGGTPCC
jgi:chaperonin GroEL (HSP60 family)